MAAPVVTLVDPTQGSTGKPQDQVIIATVEDSEFGVDITHASAFIEIAISGGFGWTTVWTGPGGFQAGWQGDASEVTGSSASYTVSIDYESLFPFGKTVNIHYRMYDLNGTVVDAYKWYITETDTIGPVAYPVTPLNGATGVAASALIQFDIKDNRDLLFLDDELYDNTIEVQFNGGGWIEVFSSWSSTNSFSAGWNGPSALIHQYWNSPYNDIGITLDYESDLPDGLVEVRVTAYDDWPYENQGITTYSFSVGAPSLISPSLISVANPASGVLHVDFSEPMLADEALVDIESYTVDPIGSSRPITITQVITTRGIPSRVILYFTGGGSPYQMTVLGPSSTSGAKIAPPTNTALFDITRPGSSGGGGGSGDGPAVDEIFSGDQLYFDTTLGGIKLGYTELSSRRIEDLVILRAQSIGFEEQIKSISKALKDSGAERDETKLKLFKG